MANSLSLLSRFKAFFAIFLLVAIVFTTVPEAWAKRPPEIRNQDDLNIRKDMHGEDLSGYEFVKLFKTLHSHVRKVLCQMDYGQQHCMHILHPHCQTKVDLRR